MGGSIRIPAAWCGVVGLKPSFGRVPFAYLASTFDTISHLGPLARSVADARLFLRHVAGHHPADPFSLPGSWTEAGRSSAQPEGPTHRRQRGPRLHRGRPRCAPGLRDAIGTPEGRWRGTWRTSISDGPLPSTKRGHSSGTSPSPLGMVIWPTVSPNDLTAPMHALIDAGRKTTGSRVDGGRRCSERDVGGPDPALRNLRLPRHPDHGHPAAARHGRRREPLSLVAGRAPLHGRPDVPLQPDLTLSCDLDSFGEREGHCRLGLQIITPPHSDDLALAIAAAAEAAFAD